MQQRYEGHINGSVIVQKHTWAEEVLPASYSGKWPRLSTASFSKLHAGGQRIAKGPMPIAPAPQKANQDPFARLTTADPFAPAVKPHSPLKAASGNTPKAGDPFASDPFGNPQFTAAPAAAPKPGTSPRVRHN